MFSTGGIGATPDDHTRQCAAAALGVPLELHPEAKVLISERIRETHTDPAKPVDFESPENQHRFNMGVFRWARRSSRTATTGFPASVGDLHFVPGFPVMAWPMIEWVLDTKYAHLHHATPHAERSPYVFELPESTLTPLMERIERDFPGVRVFSLPSVGDAERGGIYARRHIDLGVKGEPEAVAAAYEAARRRTCSAATSSNPIRRAPERPLDQPHKPRAAQRGRHRMSSPGSTMGLSQPAGAACRQAPIHGGFRKHQPSTVLRWPSASFAPSKPSSRSKAFVKPACVEATAASFERAALRHGTGWAYRPGVGRLQFVDEFGVRHAARVARPFEVQVLAVADERAADPVEFGAGAHVDEARRRIELQQFERPAGSSARRS